MECFKDQFKSGTIKDYVRLNLLPVMQRPSCSVHCITDCVDICDELYVNQEEPCSRNLYQMRAKLLTGVTTRIPGGN